MKRFCIAPLLAALALAPCQTVMAQKVEPTDAAVLSLRQAVTSQDSGVQHTLLVSLRALKDPAMKPIFEALLKAPQPPMRIDGFLGLAEIAAVHRERMAGEAVVRDVGNDHVEVDLRVGQRAEDVSGHAGLVGNAGDGDTGLGAFDRDAADDDVFHVGMFF